MRFKKIILFLMILNIFSYSVIAPLKVDAAYAKALTITAKKAAKELAQNSAVEMANHILFEMQMNEFLNSDKVEDGYKAVCLDGAKTEKECPSNKKAQIKDGLTTSDKKNLANKVENVIERKTMTSNKWSKFLDWFVPVFILGGLVAYVESLMDDDSSSLIDEIAMEALEDSGYLKPLGGSVEEVSGYDFESVLNQRFTGLTVSGSGNKNIYFFGDVKPDFSVTANYYADGQMLTRAFKSGSTLWIELYVRNGSKAVDEASSSSTNFYPRVYFDSISVGSSNFKTVSETELYLNTKQVVSKTTAQSRSLNWTEEQLERMKVGTPNQQANNLIGWINQSGANLTFDIKRIEKPPTAIDTTHLKPTEKIKSPTGTVTVPGIESFTFTNKDTKTEVYPSNESATGWKDKTTDEDIIVNEDEIEVNEKTKPDEKIEEDEDKEFPSCKKNLNKIKFNKVGTAFTNAFPFSIPWDIKRFIDASFGGIDGKKPSFQMPDSLGGAVLEIPSYFDSWISFGKTLVVIAFDISLIYMFYRLMRGGGD